MRAIRKGNEYLFDPNVLADWLAARDTSRSHCQRKLLRTGPKMKPVASHRFAAKEEGETGGELRTDEAFQATRRDARGGRHLWRD
jgi:hypothetical protein